MFHHPYFDLQIHDDAELAAIVGSKLVERITLHEWPLLRPTHPHRRRHPHLRVQAPPTVEPLFYAQARSPLLVQAQW